MLGGAVQELAGDEALLDLTQYLMLPSYYGRGIRTAPITEREPVMRSLRLHCFQRPAPVWRGFCSGTGNQDVKNSSIPVRAHDAGRT